MADPEIGNAIIAGIASGDGPLEQMSEIVTHLERAGFVIVPKVPTEEMKQAFYRSSDGWDFWPSMIDAALAFGGVLETKEMVSHEWYGRDAAEDKRANGKAEAPRQRRRGRCGVRLPKPSI